MPDHTRINVFGRFEALKNGGPVQVRARKAQAMLAILAIENSTPQGRERLAAKRQIRGDSLERGSR